MRKIQYVKFVKSRFQIELQKEKHPIGSSNLNHWKQILKIFRENQNK